MHYVSSVKGIYGTRTIHWSGQKEFVYSKEKNTIYCFLRECQKHEELNITVKNKVERKGVIYLFCFWLVFSSITRIVTDVSDLH